MKTQLNISVETLSTNVYELEVLKNEFNRVSEYFLDLGKKIDTYYTKRKKNLEIALGVKGRFDKTANSINLDELNKEYIALERYLHTIRLQANYVYKTWLEYPKN